ncbi:hypothetical protein JAAARDRAFT_666553 [Jaapia argillacea MUCL 33604]|uniref:Uncharacterized protein n=1 Tax=Jaapia argillacea MUCL 33604 TaxID=933084 RepID=A0A067PUI0_9AGAM|nr:hypothetical protein JAAARDRAFT_666553 [Jaapia argillacea MUCL 33604]
MTSILEGLCALVLRCNQRGSQPIRGLLRYGGGGCVRRLDGPRSARSPSLSWRYRRDGSFKDLCATYVRREARGQRVSCCRGRFEICDRLFWTIYRMPDSSLALKRRHGEFLAYIPFTREPGSRLSAIALAMRVYPGTQVWRRRSGSRQGLI